MPVAHGDEAAGINAEFTEFLLQRARLLLGETPYGRSAADDGVMVLNFSRARSGNQLGERLAPDAGKAKINDIGVTKEVVKERLNGFQPVGPTKLEQNYPHS